MYRSSRHQSLRANGNSNRSTSSNTAQQHARPTAGNFAVSYFGYELRQEMMERETMNANNNQGHNELRLSGAPALTLRRLTAQPLPPPGLVGSSSNGATTPRHLGSTLIPPLNALPTSPSHQAGGTSPLATAAPAPSTSPTRAATTRSRLVMSRASSLTRSNEVLGSEQLAAMRLAASRAAQTVARRRQEEESRRASLPSPSAHRPQQPTNANARPWRRNGTPNTSSDVTSSGTGTQGDTSDENMDSTDSEDDDSDLDMSLDLDDHSSVSSIESLPWCRNQENVKKKTSSSRLHPILTDEEFRKLVASMPRPTVDHQAVAQLRKANKNKKQKESASASNGWCAKSSGAADWADNENDDEDLYTCSICCDTYTDPVKTVCSHNFCRTCIERSIGEFGNPKCPLCNRKFDTPAKRTFSSDSKLQRAIATLPMVCPMSGSDKPTATICCFRGSAAEMEEHLRVPSNNHHQNANNRKTADVHICPLFATVFRALEMNAVAQSMKKLDILVGNTYRRRNVPPTTRSKHAWTVFVKPRLSRPSECRQRQLELQRRWQDFSNDADSMSLPPVASSQQTKVLKVVFHMWSGGKVVKTEPPFECSRIGWGTFDVLTEVYTTETGLHGQPHRISIGLDFDAPKTQRHVLLYPGSDHLVHEFSEFETQRNRSLEEEDTVSSSSDDSDN